MDRSFSASASGAARGNSCEIAAKCEEVYYVHLVHFLLNDTRFHGSTLERERKHALAMGGFAPFPVLRNHIDPSKTIIILTVRLAAFSHHRSHRRDTPISFFAERSLTTSPSSSIGEEPEGTPSRFTARCVFSSPHEVSL